MPTKERKRNEAELNRFFKDGRARKSTKSFPVNNELSSGFNPLICEIDDDGSLVLNPKVGSGGNDLRKADREDCAKDLKKRYPEYWKRGGAKRLAGLAGKSVRTIQQYIKDFP